ncbi:MAG: 1,6-anhydro-N-acetylmuramyl-L-alanine amidase AmpD [Betaproteobacteria bacterium]
MTGGEPPGFDAQGWLAGVRRVPSPHCDPRPPGAAVELVVIHGISLPPGRCGGPHIEDLFLGRLDPAADPYFREIEGLRVSAHFLVRRDGEVVQFVPCGLRAWHAGQSTWSGRQRCNDFSVGIELEGTDHQTYEPAQYQALVPLARALLAAYPIRALAGHCDIAPGRKTDPGPFFDWARLRAALA